MHHPLYAHNRLRNPRTTAPPADRTVIATIMIGEANYHVGCPGAAVVVLTALKQTNKHD